MMPRLSPFHGVLALSLACNVALAYALLRDDGAAPSPPPPPALPPAAREASEPAPAEQKRPAPSVDALAQLLQRSARAASSDASASRGRARVDEAVIGETRCRIAIERAAESFRNDADGIREALEGDFDEADRERQVARHTRTLTETLGADDDDARVRSLAKRYVELEAEAREELRELMAASDGPDWRAATEVVAGMYRQQHGATALAYGADAAEEVRLAYLDERTTILAIGQSLARVSWDSYDDATPPAVKRR